MMSGCSSLTRVQSVTVSSNIHWVIQPANAMNALTDKTVQLTAIYGGESHRMLVTTESSIELFIMVALTAQGIPLFELTLNNESVIQSKTYVPLSIDPEYILSDMQLINLPLVKIQENLIGAKVTETLVGGNVKRSIKHGNTRVIDIEYRKNTIEFYHYQRNYRLLIDALR